MAEPVLWTQKECAEALRVSQRWLRSSSCPRVLLQPNRGGRQLVRYDPVKVRAWFSPKQKTSAA